MTQEDDCSEKAHNLVTTDDSLSRESMEEMEVSFHAILGLIGNNLMKLVSKIDSFSRDILVDLESTHNFLNPFMEVKVVNGQKLFSKGHGQEVIKVQGVKFLVPFYILPLGGCDVVLEIQWLKTLD